MSDLARFQDAFGQALAGDVAALGPWAVQGADPGLSVYRNTIAKGCADALAANFPTLARVVGEGWMAEAAVRFARERPPTEPSLMAYGVAFPAWLSTFAPAAEMPWLADLARIDQARTRVLFAADLAPLAPSAFAALSPEAWTGTVAELHPAAATLWFHQGVPGLWAALQADPAPTDAELAPEPQGLLLTRPAGEVQYLLLGPGGFALLDACRRGESLAGAGAAALAAEPGLPLADAFAEITAAGAFARMRGRPGSVS